MKKIIFLGLAFCGLLSIQSCSLDNYDEPSASLTGVLVDTQTSKSIPCQYQNGARIRMYEFYNDSWTKQPNDVYTKQDGSFTNNAVFPGKYKVIAEGAFITPDTIEIDLSKTAALEIKATPYLRISSSATLSGVNINMTANVETTSANRTIKTVEFYCARTPYVDKNTYEKKITVSNINSLENVNYSKMFESLTKGNTYYVRVGALGENSGNYFNYSEIIELKIP